MATREELGELIENAMERFKTPVTGPGDAFTWVTQRLREVWMATADEFGLTVQGLLLRYCGGKDEFEKGLNEIADEIADDPPPAIDPPIAS